MKAIKIKSCKECPHLIYLGNEHVCGKMELTKQNEWGHISDVYKIHDSCPLPDFKE